MSYLSNASVLLWCVLRITFRASLIFSSAWENIGTRKQRWNSDSQHLLPLMLLRLALSSVAIFCFQIVLLRNHISSVNVNFHFGDKQLNKRSNDQPYVFKAEKRNQLLCNTATNLNQSANFLKIRNGINLIVCILSLEVWFYLNKIRFDFLF